MTVALEAFPAFYDNSGNPLSGGKVYTFQAGTSTPLASYTDRGGLVANANPVVLNSAGRASIWLSTNVAYKIRIDDAAGNVIATVDDYYAGADPAQLVAAGIVPATGGTYTGAVSFTGGATFDGTTAQDLATLNSLNIAGVMTSNLWTNPDFYVNQRAATTAADAAIGYDRARVLCDGGSVTLSSFDTAGLTLAGNAIRLTQPDAVAKRIGLSQIAEAKDCLSYRGKNLALAFQIRCSAAATIRCALVAWTGAQDAPTADVVNNWTSTNYTAGNFFIANTSTIATAAVAASAATWTDLVVSSSSAGGVTVPLTMTNLYMLLWSENTLAQNVTLDITSVRCAQGTVAPLWTPPNAQQEFDKCKRFLPAWQSTTVNDQVGTGQCISAVQSYINFAFDVEARVPPSGITANGTYAVTSAAGGAVALTGMTLVVSGRRAVLIGAPVAAGLVAGDATTLQGTNAASRFILTGAEL